MGPRAPRESSCASPRLAQQPCWCIRNKTSRCSRTDQAVLRTHPCSCLYSPNFQDGFAVLHSQGETLSSLAGYLVFPQSAERELSPRQPPAGRGLSHPHPSTKPLWSLLGVWPFSGTHSRYAPHSHSEGPKGQRRPVRIPLQVMVTVCRSSATERSLGLSDL